MIANQANGALKAFRGSRRADVSLVVASLLAAALLGASSAAFLGGPSALRAWSSWHVGLILYVIPSPDLLFSFVSVATRSDYIHIAILDLMAAGLMVAAAIGIGKSRRWAYWLYSCICLSAVIGRSYTIWKIWTPTYGAPALPTPYLGLGAVGVAVALAAAWYASQRALSFGRNGITSATKPARASASIPWVIATLAGFALVCVWMRTAQVLGNIDAWQVRYELRRGILMALAYACVLLFGFLRPTRRFAASLALGVAVMGFITVGGLGLSGLTQLALAWALSAAVRPWAAFAILGFLLGNAVLAVAALVSMIRRRTFHIGLVALAVVFVGSIDPALQTLRQYDVQRSRLAEDLAKGGPYIMFRAENCLLRYKAMHPTAGFPDSLVQVDGALPGCLQSGLAKGREIGSYRVEYQSAGSAPHAHFSLIAIPSVHDTQGMISFFADESSIVRTFTGKRVAEASDGGVTPAEDFYSVRTCLRDFDTLFGEAKNGTPAENPPGQRLGRYPVSFAEMVPRDRCYLRGQLDGDAWKTAAYRFSYREFTQGGAENFAFSARPLQYAVTGLRSYFMDNTFVVHATSEDRYATANDPVADVCEFLSLLPCGQELATPVLQR